MLMAFAALGRAGEKVINTDAIKAEVTRTIRANSPWDKKDLKIDDIRFNGGMKGCENADTFRVEAPVGGIELGKLTVAVKFYSGGRVFKTVWASARVRAYKDAVIALDSLGTNARIAAGDVKLARIELNRARDSFGSLKDVVGMTVKRPISPGSVIKRDFVKPNVLVKRGSRVVLMVQNKGLIVKSDGIAVEDGFDGETIKARTKSGKEIMGMVTGRDELTLDW